MNDPFAELFGTLRANNPFEQAPGTPRKPAGQHTPPGSKPPVVRADKPKPVDNPMPKIRAKREVEQGPDGIHRDTWWLRAEDVAAALEAAQRGTPGGINQRLIDKIRRLQ